MINKRVLGKIFTLMVLSLFLTTVAEAATITSFSLHGQTDAITFNPATGEDSPLSILITTDQLVKFTTIAICFETDAVCNRTSAFKYFTTSSFADTVEKSWNGQNSKGELASDGVYKIKVTMKDENDVSNEEFISAGIIIDSSTSALPGGSEGDIGDDQDPEGSEGTSLGANSAHSSQVSLSNFEETKLTIGAGRSRLVSVRTPLKFQAETKGTMSGRFEWSFGDGTLQVGSTVSHKYQFPGSYNVVLNFTSSDGREAVSRTKVTVTESDFDLTLSSDKRYLEVKNLSKQEENINDWKIKAGTTTVFGFAKDTIISGNSSLKIGLSKKALENGEISLNYPDDSLVAKIDSGKTLNQAKLSELRDKLSKAQVELASLQRVNTSLAAVGSVKFAQKTLNDEENPESLEAAKTSSNSATSDIIIIGKKEGMVTKILKAVKKIF